MPNITIPGTHSRASVLSEREISRQFRNTISTVQYREFVTKVMERYYGREFLTEIEGTGTLALAYTIMGVPYTAKVWLDELDKYICPIHQLNTGCSGGRFYVKDHQNYTEYPLYKEYSAIVGKNIKFPNRPGYMFDRLYLDEEGRVESFASHVGTYAENVYSCHVLEYEMYRVYQKFAERFRR